VDGDEAVQAAEAEVLASAIGAGGGAFSLPPLPEDSLETGVVPKVIRSIIQRRVGVKNILKQEKDPSKRQTLDIRQKALKLTANSLYGCLGFAHSRFYAKPIAALVTAMGRETLQRTVDLAQTQLNMEVIYGDTDSIMINTNSTDLKHVKELGQQVKREVNKLYKTLELELDGVFKSMLLLKKKKYAALVVEEGKDGQVCYSKETKGLDLVRRDWCPISKSLGQFVLDRILSGDSKDEVVASIHERLGEVAAAMRAKPGVAIEEYVVTKGMNKAVKDYPDAKSQPHLQVALAMLAEGKPVNVGDHIPYVICVDHAKPVQEASFALRAFHPDAVVKSAGALSVDVEWYLTQQVLPPIARLCEPIEGTSTAALAEHLGLDGAKFARMGGGGQQGGGDDLFDLCDYVPTSKQSDEERFRDAAPLGKLECAKCGCQSAFRGALVPSLPAAAAAAAGAAADPTKGVTWASGFACPLAGCGAEFFGAPGAAACFAKMSNALALNVRGEKLKYYESVVMCDDSSCGHKTQQLSVMGNGCVVRGCQGRMAAVYSDKRLFTQLKYLEELMDVDLILAKRGFAARAAQVKGACLPKAHADVANALKLQMASELDCSAYNWVPKSFWQTAFEPSEKPGGGAKGKSRPAV